MPAVFSPSPIVKLLASGINAKVCFPKALVSKPLRSGSFPNTENELSGPVAVRAVTGFPFTSWEITKDSLLGRCGQCGADENLLLQITLSFEESEEERFVFNDRAAQADAILMAVVVVLWRVIEVVKPC
jgi:hypothetical protein